MTTRGFSLIPGLVRGEACHVRILPMPNDIDYVGREFPSELFDRELEGQIHEVGKERKEGGTQAVARLLDPWLDGNLHPMLGRLFGAEPPSPFPYRVTPIHFLNGWTRESTLRTGDECFVWIKADGNIPWLERAPDLLPSAFPEYPHEHLVGFWQARVTAIIKPRDPAVKARKVRAVLIDDRIRDHAHPSVRKLYGHEPWTDYSATLTDDRLGEAGAEMLDEIVDGVQRLASRLSRI
ncbi:hypothetical protein A2348_00625 [Candidatus Uhrbacteria bacterium RIFOXYB12_FULL_58_10]|uniref:Uncharacterized protein n=1 Tax=Candidatus Uhrbacteria bacterium RIFOXYB2_FULL_57_15 TaxID=1802422 RepID=A0A1F7W6H9_9BACT|nr:MAG: hypothetical protein A2348_00625 [Candidatus Uhrbacteria bacterium RIFOXYB12_FULL_58_10]OGL98411.1 MAG: hypothetical protein A2304_01810 [Candidatus Uhrbacteria bacterium RIFOXYB2_FULL_57_15]